MTGPDRLEANPTVPQELRPLNPNILGRLLPILEDKLNIPADELLENPDVRILEDKKGVEETLGASSLQAVRAVLAVERKWGIKVPDSETKVYRTLRSIVYKLEDVEIGRAGTP